MTAIVLDTTIELVFLDLAKGDQQKPDFLKLNPGGKVPVLVDDDFVLTESLAIMQYLADKKPGNNVYPSELRARATVNRWMFWAAAHWGPSIAGLNFEHYLKRLFGQGEPDPAQVKRQEQFFRGFAKLLDQHLTGRAWVAGDGLTLADLAIAAPLMYADSAKLPLEGFEALTRWFAEVQALDAWKKTAPTV